MSENKTTLAVAVALFAATLALGWLALRGDDIQAARMEPNPFGTARCETDDDCTRLCREEKGRDCEVAR